MSCLEIESKILDYQENQLPPAQRREVEIHLAGCAQCRSFARQLQQLDAALTACVKAPALSVSFDQRLRQRIPAMPAMPSEPQRAERQRRLQAEYEEDMARIRRNAFALHNLLHHLTWPGLAALAVWFLWRFTPQITSHFKAQSLGGLDPNLLPWLAASVIFLIAGLGQAFPRPWRILRVW
ncbi:MAG: zf-HC2 domain-containing protein [Verrucomicrobiota bacterium]|jgi:anti-sigma factor RsiW